MQVAKSMTCAGVTQEFESKRREQGKLVPVSDAHAARMRVIAQVTGPARV